ncbi:class I SAM-dependent methyltransferase [Phenylobacterium sp.]|jgi:SAM-dependent methyltransferase|uniref:class I SAM-dependent methyltransferase n=1 Tax=Phenylobacterium sp. TaxID=1871053 RepID=UPI002F941683
MPTFLHVGCGQKRKDRTTAGFNGPQWTEVRLDISPDVQPDVIADMTDMSPVDSGSVDAIFSSHNIEHLYIHEVPTALAEFQRVLKPDGFVVITCPDLQMVANFVAGGRLTEPLYTSPAGPISAMDILYGHGAAIARGQVYMAHRCGFTLQTLVNALTAAGFLKVAAKRRRPFLDLWAVASKADLPEAELQALARAHFPD